MISLLFALKGVFFRKKFRVGC